jgi:hypothetical protein
LCRTGYATSPPTTGATPKLARQGDIYVVTVPAVAWTLQFAAGDLEVIDTKERPGGGYYYMLVHKNIVPILKKSLGTLTKEEREKQIAEVTEEGFWSSSAASPTATWCRSISLIITGPEAQNAYERKMRGKSDAERLDSFLKVVEALPLIEVRRSSEWVSTPRAPQRRFGAVCRERHDVREDREAKDGGSLWQDWMFFCVDPLSHIPIQIDYAEGYPAAGGAVSPSFPRDAAAFFDSIEFRPQAN